MRSPTRRARRSLPSANPLESRAPASILIPTLLFGRWGVGVRLFSGCEPVAPSRDDARQGRVGLGQARLGIGWIAAITIPNEDGTRRS